MNPFDLRGPEFLLLFITLFTAAAATGSLLRRRLADPELPARAELAQPDPYEIAFLAGGHGRAVEAAVASLAQRGLLSADPQGRRVRLEHPPEEELHPLEAGVVRVLQRTGEAPLDRLTAALEADTWSLRRSLEQGGLLLTQDDQARRRWFPALPLFAVTLFGVIKMGVGVSRDRPVGFLVLLCIASFITALVYLLGRVDRSRRGEALLERLSRKHAALRLTAGSSTHSLLGTDVGTAVGLFGVGVLATGPLSDVAATLRRPDQGGGGYGSTASSCGSSGGDGGGGGGCGGGGCGGCGGG